MLKGINKANAGFMVVFSALALGACGGGGSGSSDGGKDPGAVKFKPGLFNSIIPNEAEETGIKAYTLISPSGKYSITSKKTRTSGKVTFPTNNTLSDEDAVYVFFDEKWRSLDGSLKGQSINLEEFAVTFTADNAEPGVEFDSVSIRDNELSDMGLALQDLDGTYSLPDNEFVVTILADGSEAEVTGATKYESGGGCAIYGSVTVPNSKFNVFEGSLTFSGCPDADEAKSDQRDGKYDVIGYLEPLGDGLKRLEFSGDNGQVTTVFSGKN